MKYIYLRKNYHNYGGELELGIVLHSTNSAHMLKPYYFMIFIGQFGS